MKTRLFLEAQDVWFFRTSRPFGATQAASSDGEPHLLPPAGVVFGAIRTGLGNRHRIRWDDYHEEWAHGTPNTPLFRRLGPPRPMREWPAESVRLHGCLPARLRHGQQETLFPLPAFVLRTRDHGRRIVGADLRLARPFRETAGRSSAGDLWPVTADDEVGFEPLLIDAASLAQLLRGNGPETFDAAPVERRMLAEVEPRIGIARESLRRTVKKGHLYTLQTHRWASRVGFRDDAATYGLQLLATSLTPDDLGSPAALPVGGEGRLAWATVDRCTGWLADQGDLTREIRDAIEQKRGWWLYLATPAAFTTGWRPSWVGDDLVARVNGTVAGRLVGLTAEPPVLHSGWDLGRRPHPKPKPVRRLMAEGTTYFFELAEDAGAAEAALSLHETCLADDLAHAGSGLAFVGAWERR